MSSASTFWFEPFCSMTHQQSNKTCLCLGSHNVFSYVHHRHYSPISLYFAFVHIKNLQQALRWSRRQNINTIHYYLKMWSKSPRGMNPSVDWPIEIVFVTEGVDSLWFLERTTCWGNETSRLYSSKTSLSRDGDFYEGSCLSTIFSTYWREWMRVSTGAKTVSSLLRN